MLISRIRALLPRLRSLLIHVLSPSPSMGQYDLAPPANVSAFKGYP